MEDNRKSKMNLKKVIWIILGFILIFGALYLLESSIGAELGHIGQSIWLVAGIFWLIGGAAWIVSYIGAPLASKKAGRYVSGIPGVAFICFLIAGLISPCKWLALLALVDVGVTIMPLYGKMKKDKEKK